MKDVIIRAATLDDIDGLTSLRILWADLPKPPTTAAIQSFRRTLAEWMASRPDTVMTAVAEWESELVGMAWLVLFERVPNIDQRARMTEDIQSVFVLPGQRRRGIGRALVDALLSAADRMGVPRVTVSANQAAMNLYLDAGFNPRNHLLERRLEGESDY